MVCEKGTEDAGEEGAVVGPGEGGGCEELGEEGVIGRGRGSR